MRDARRFEGVSISYDIVEYILLASSRFVSIRTKATANGIRVDLRTALHIGTFDGGVKLLRRGNFGFWLKLVLREMSDVWKVRI